MNKNRELIKDINLNDLTNEELEDLLYQVDDLSKDIIILLEERGFYENG